jgi:hypothetical protein
MELGVEEQRKGEENECWVRERKRERGGGDEGAVAFMPLIGRMLTTMEAVRRCPPGGAPRRSSYLQNISIKINTKERSRILVVSRIRPHSAKTEMPNVWFVRKESKFHQVNSSTKPIFYIKRL